MTDAVRMARYVPFIIAGVFAAFFLVERFIPLRRSCAPLLPRLVVNLAVSGLAFLTAMLSVKPATMYVLNWAAESPFGVIHAVAMPGWLAAVVGFLLLDLSFYYWHVLNHRFSALWRFHNVHHIDPDLDVSTGFRFHFGEVLLSTGFRVVQVSLIGIPFTVFAAYELVFQANTLFHHSNLRLPIRIERLLNLILVTPRMHGIHHSQVRGETNSNYGVVFCWWDKLHRTIGLNIPQSQIEIGVAGYSAPGDNRLWQTLTMPFRRQRDYWHRADGSLPQRDQALSEGNRSRLAE